MNNKLWFNFAPPGNQQMAMANNFQKAPQNVQAVATNTGKPNTSPVIATGVMTGGNTPINTGGATLNTGMTKVDNNANTGGNIVCNDCNNGYPVSNQFPGPTCPPGWTSDKDPCKSNVITGCMDPLADNFDSMATADSGNCVYTNPPVPVPQDDCYNCADGTITRVDQGNCPQGTDIVVVPVGADGSSKNPCPTTTQEIIDEVEEEKEEEEIVEEALKPATAGLGDNKTLLYIAIGIGIVLLLRK